MTLTGTFRSSDLQNPETPNPEAKIPVASKSRNCRGWVAKLIGFWSSGFWQEAIRDNQFHFEQFPYRKPQGQIVLDDLCRIIRAEGASTFEIDTGKKVYYLTADSNATMDDWIRVLQNVQRRNATKLLLSRDDQKATVQGWVTKVKNGHAKKCWSVLLGKMFLYFKAPGETVSLFNLFFLVEFNRLKCSSESTRSN